MERQMSRTWDFILVGLLNDGSDCRTCSGADPDVDEIAEVVINDSQFTARKKAGLNMSTRSMRLILIKDFYMKRLCQSAIE
jgi:hypothetical protein